MFSDLKVLQTSMAMARHAGARQALTAANLANADTPGYRARHIAPFSDTYQTSSGMALRQSRTGHVPAATGSSVARSFMADAEPAPNGNSVSVELEMVNAVEIQREHNRALAIYSHALNVLRSSIGRR